MTNREPAGETTFHAKSTASSSAVRAAISVPLDGTCSRRCACTGPDTWLWSRPCVCRCEKDPVAKLNKSATRAVIETLLLTSPETSINCGKSQGRGLNRTGLNTGSTRQSLSTGDGANRRHDSYLEASRSYAIYQRAVRVQVRGEIHQSE